MAITVVANPVSLTWSNFRPSAVRLIDPSDGTFIDALTRFNYNIANRPFQRIDGQFALADQLTITITPNARVYTGVTQTDALLSHEQLHYDVGIVTGRALARDLRALRSADQAGLIAAAQTAVELHFSTRAGAIQRRYDQDTRHGTDATTQTLWKDRMSACLANPDSDMLSGLQL
jgi:hypothetical protein